MSCCRRRRDFLPVNRCADGDTNSSAGPEDSDVAAAFIALAVTCCCCCCCCCFLRCFVVGVVRCGVGGDTNGFAKMGYAPTITVAFLFDFGSGVNQW